MRIAGNHFLVTGGAGFVGSCVVEALLAQGAGKVLVIDNLLRGSHRNMMAFSEDPRIHFYQADICETKILKQCLSGIDGVFHLAAHRILRCAEDPIAGHRVMVDATFDLVELARRSGVAKIVYSSSASVYGQAQTLPTSETEPPYENRTLYGAAKLYGEQLLRSYHDMFGLDYVALRYFNIYGPRMDTEGKYTEVLIRWLDCIRDGRRPLIFGDGLTSMDFVYVEDVARANILAMLSDATDVAVNVGSGQMTSLTELLQQLLSVNQSALQPQYQSERRVNPVRKRQAATRLARELLGFEAEIDLAEGLRRLSEWYFSLQEREMGVDV